MSMQIILVVIFIQVVFPCVNFAKNFEQYMSFGAPDWLCIVPSYYVGLFTRLERVFFSHRRIESRPVQTPT